MVVGLLAYTVYFWFQKAQEKKSKGVKSHDLDFHFRSPKQEIKRPGNVSWNNAIAPRDVCQAAPSSWNYMSSRSIVHPIHLRHKKTGLSCRTVGAQAQQQKLWQIQIFSLLICFLKLCKATCCATHCGSRDTSVSASQKWSTIVYANKPTTIQALKEEIRGFISEI